MDSRNAQFPSKASRLWRALLTINPRGHDRLTLRRAEALTLTLLFTFVMFLMALPRSFVDQQFLSPIVLIALLSSLGAIFMFNRYGWCKFAISAFVVWTAVVVMALVYRFRTPSPAVFLILAVLCFAATFGRPKDILSWAAGLTLIPFLMNLSLYDSLLAPTTPIALPDGLFLPSFQHQELWALFGLWAVAGSAYAMTRLLHQIIEERTQAESALLIAQADLENQVATRTAELSRTNLLLRQQIDERVQIEMALRLAQSHQRALLDTIPDRMFRVTQSGVILDFKAEKGQEEALARAMPISKTLDALMPIELAQQTMGAIREALGTNTTQIYEYQLPENDIISDGEARIAVSGAGEVVIMMRDITERKKAERLKDEFIATVSHELRTPLTSIHGSLGLMLGGVTGVVQPPLKAMMMIAYQNSERLIRLINDLLDIQKLEAGKMHFVLRPVELLPLIDRAIADNQAYACQFNVTLKLAQIEPGLVAMVDSDRLIQVLTNLLSNAVKFSPTDDQVDIALLRISDGARIMVTDHGPGIPDSFRDHLFQKFAQADSSDTRQKGGTGLGLSICKAIVERLDGQIRFEPAPGGGSCFLVDLPTLSADALDSDTPADTLLIDTA